MATSYQSTYAISTHAAAVAPKVDHVSVWNSLLWPHHSLHPLWLGYWTLRCLRPILGAGRLGNWPVRLFCSTFYFRIWPIRGFSDLAWCFRVGPPISHIIWYPHIAVASPFWIHEVFETYELRRNPRCSIHSRAPYPCLALDTVSLSSVSTFGVYPSPYTSPITMLKSLVLGLDAFLTSRHFLS